MNPKTKDIIVSKEILNLFKNNVRIIDKRHLAGMWPVDVFMLKRLQDLLPQMFDKNILEKYDLAIGYKGKDIKGDFAKAGIKYVDDRIINHILIHGIPVPWQLLKKAGIDHQKFEVVLTQRM